MTDKKTRLFLGQLYEHEGKYGSYITGPFAAGRLWIERSKEPGKWNMYLSENEKREKRDVEPVKQSQRPLTDDEIPF